MMLSSAVNEKNNPAFLRGFHEGGHKTPKLLFNRFLHSDVAKNTEFKRFRTQIWLKTQNLTGSEPNSDMAKLQNLTGYELRCS